MPVVLYLLALAVFAMGTSEFVLAGLLPEIASDLHVSVSAAGTLTPAFAVGMVLGAPTAAALARRLPRRPSLVGFVLTFAAAHAVGALTPSFPVLFATRILAAVVNAGFLAVALTVAVELVAPQKKGRALAVLLSGTTVATVAGVPGGAVLGTVFGWRATFWAVAALCVPTALAVGRSISTHVAPTQAGGPPLRAELAQLACPRLALVMVLGALANAATFGSFTYLAPVITDTAGLSEPWVPLTLVLFGVGSLAGVTVAGRLSDRRPGLVVAVGGPSLLAGWAALAVLAEQPAVLLAGVFVQGALSFALGSTLVTRVLHEAAAAPTMAGSYATVALNVGAVAGPLIAATTLNTCLGPVGPLWASALLVVLTLLVAGSQRAVFAAGQSGHAHPAHPSEAR